MMGFFEPDNRDADFMSELEAASSLRPKASAVAMLLVIAALVIFCLVWAGLAPVDEIVRGQGQVVPSQEIQVVQSLEGGLISEVLVKEGERVEKGQILMRLSDIEFSSQERGTEAKSLSLKAKKARLEAEAGGEGFIPPEDVLKKTPKIAENELALYQSRQKELSNVYAILDDRIDKASADLSEVDAEINRLTQSRKLLRRELDITTAMVKKRAVPKLEQIRLERELADISGQINVDLEKKKSLQAEREVAMKEQAAQDDKFRSQALGELNSVEAEIAGLEETLKSMGDRVYRAELRAPVTGVVNNIALKTIGGVVEPAKPLIEIVPVDDELKIVARVQPRDIAFIHFGQKVKVKITAYDAQKYGALDGHITRIGANSIIASDGNVFFEIEARTTKNYLGSKEKPLPITPGMIAQTEIITGKRTILEYLLKPILRARGRAFTER